MIHTSSLIIPTYPIRNSHLQFITIFVSVIAFTVKIITIQISIFTIYFEECYFRKIQWSKFSLLVFIYFIEKSSKKTLKVILQVEALLMIQNNPKNERIRKKKSDHKMIESVCPKKKMIESECELL